MCSGSVPVGNVEFRFASSPDPCHFLRQSGGGNFAEFPVSIYDDFPAGILFPSSGFFSWRIRRESAGKNTICGGIRPDPMIGIIDLGNACLSALIFILILSERDALCLSFCVGLSFQPQGREGYLILDDSSDCQRLILISGKLESFLETHTSDRAEKISDINLSSVFINLYTLKKIGLIRNLYLR